MERHAAPLPSAARPAQTWKQRCLSAFTGLAVFASAWVLAPTGLISQRAQLLNGQVGSYSYETAQEGYYWIAPQSQTGSVTVTPVGGNAVTKSLDDSDGAWNCPSNFMFGTVSYQHSTVWTYTWIPGYAGDTPIDQPEELSGSSSVLLYDTSAALQLAGSASGQVSMLGKTNSNSGTATPHPPGNPEVHIDQTGLPVNHNQTVILTGDEGTFTVDVSGSLSTGAYGVFGGYLTVNPPIAGYSFPLAIKSPPDCSTFTHGVQFNVTGVFYDAQGTINSERKVLVFAQHELDGTEYLKGEVSITGRTGKWTVPISIDGPGPVSIWALQRRKQPDGTYMDVSVTDHNGLVIQ